MELLKLAYGLDMTHVPFGGSGPVKNALLGGHVQVGATALSPVLPVIRSGDITALVTSATRRNPAIASVPTMIEKGQPDASLSTRAELWAPAETRSPRSGADLTGRLKVVGTLIGLLVYALVLEPLGFLLATFALLLFFFTVLQRQRWPVALGGSLATALLTYLVFKVWL